MDLPLPVVMTRTGAPTHTSEASAHSKPLPTVAASGPGQDAWPRAVRAADTLAAARDYLFGIQAEDGHWRAELEGDSILESEYILLMHFLGRADEAKAHKAGEYLRRVQRPDGGWTSYPGGPVDVSASAKAYFTLKLLGDDPAAPHMVRARERILEAGGLDACNSFTKIYLAVFGQYPWSRCPAVPPEMILLPRWFPFHIYRMSAWSRTIFVPLSVVWALKPYVAVPPEAAVPELLGGASPALPAEERLEERLWRAFFMGMDRVLKLLDGSPVKPLRERALAAAEAWILPRLDKSDGLGAIFPPIVNTIVALRARGYALDHPVIQAQIRELEALEIEEEDTLRVQPCLSPVWDTALTLNSLLGAGAPADDPRVLAAARWLLDREVRAPGDWTEACGGVEPAGWYFEYENEFYPDLDDTVQVLSVLARVRFPDRADEGRRKRAMRRGTRWLRAMQNDDGGWAAFDRGCDAYFLTHVPFADHNAMIDPSCEDITGRALECLHILGARADDGAVRAGVRFLLDRQRPDGTWYGRWGCNYVYGTWLAVHGLTRGWLDPHDDRVQAAARWLRGHQNLDGGWGESPASYDDPSAKGRGPSTAAQTAWALLALFAVGDHDSPAVERGVDYLVRTQEPDGCWRDEPWTGTGFPRIFYLRYHLYATYFPLLALGTYLERDRT